MLKRDWEGRYVRLKTEMSNNGGQIFDKGEVMRVTRNYGGLRLMAIHRCPCCEKRSRRYIAKVSEADVELLPEDFAPERATP